VWIAQLGHSLKALHVRVPSARDRIVICDRSRWRWKQVMSTSAASKDTNGRLLQMMVSV
jgi:hypothetical protein